MAFPQGNIQSKTSAWEAIIVSGLPVVLQDAPEMTASEMLKLKKRISKNGQHQHFLTVENVDSQAPFNDLGTSEFISYDSFPKAEQSSMKQNLRGIWPNEKWDQCVHPDPILVVTNCTSEIGCLTPIHVDHGVSHGYVIHMSGTKIWMFWRLEGGKWPDNGYPRDPLSWKPPFMVAVVNRGQGIYLPEGIVHAVWTLCDGGAIALAHNFPPTQGGFVALAIFAALTRMFKQKLKADINELLSMCTIVGKHDVLNNSARENINISRPEWQYWERKLTSWYSTNKAVVVALLARLPVTCNLPEYNPNRLRTSDGSGATQKMARRVYSHKKSCVAKKVA